MKRVGSGWLVLIVMVHLHTAELSAAESIKAETRTFTMDKIYPSMFGPRDASQVSLGQRGDEPELLWVTAVRSDMVGADGETPESAEYFCHTTIGRSAEPPPDLWSRLQKLGMRNWNQKVFTLVQGLNEIRFPEGFGLPVFSGDQFLVTAMAMNPSVPEQPVRVGIDSRIEYVRASERDHDMRPLFVVPLVLTVPVEDPHAGHNHESGDHGETCLDADSPPRASKSVNPNATYNGHWYVPPGRHVYRHRFAPLSEQIPFDTKVHYIASHLHPYGTSLELVDVTTGESVYKATARNFTDRVAIEEITHYSSQEGLSIDLTHEHELRAVYDNTTDHEIDSMAVMYLYLADSFGSDQASWLFGFDENIHCVEDVALEKFPGEALCLAQKSTRRHLVLGVSLSDDGYVLAVKSDDSEDPERYYPFIGEEVALYQESGLLPSPLPEYSIPIRDYLWGYSFWMLMGIGIAGTTYRGRRPAR